MNILSVNSLRAAARALGEFYSPGEVGIIMAIITCDPEPGMSFYDPCGGSAGLLIKGELVLNDENAGGGKEKYHASHALRSRIHRFGVGHGQYEHDHS